MDMEKIRLGFIGVGGRGKGIAEMLATMPGVEIKSVCDVYGDRVDDTRKSVNAINGDTPKGTTEYREVCEDPEVDAVIITSAWENHIPASVYSMRCGKHTACEVAGAYSIDDCWELIRAYEETSNHCMLLENCCYGRTEMLLLRMIKEGIFGKVVHCEGGYHHDLRDEICYGIKNRHYRLRNYMNRNCENYPTHELGPIAKMLDINRGNRMVTLSSMASGSWGLNEFAKTHDDAPEFLRDYRFVQGDVVKTNIKCAHGEMITLTLDTTLPHHYSRGLVVRGTKASYNEWSDSIFLNEYGEGGNERFNNTKQYFEKYEHPVWKNYIENGVTGGHDGFDWLEYLAFFDSIREGQDPPIDTYDMAAWMAITPLSEISIANGGLPVDIPDFTRGQWTYRTDGYTGFYNLNTIPEM